MPHNKEPKTSLGLVLLPFPKAIAEDDFVSYEEYKRLTGVDLNQIFRTTFDDDNNVYEVRFRPDFTKIICFRVPEEYGGDPEVPTVCPVATANINHEHNATLDDAYVTFQMSQHDAYGYIVVVYHDKIKWLTN